MSSAEPPWRLYERHADLWTRLRSPGVSIEQNWIERFRQALHPGARILDIGCGHGQPIGADLLEDGFDVWGIDRAPAQIENARKALPEGRWTVADMTSFDLGQTFDGLIMWHSLFHLTATEQRLVFPLLARHAASDAVLLFTSGSTAGSVNGEFGGDVLAHHSLDYETYVDLLAAEDFVVLDHRESDPDCGNATVWLAKHSG